MRVAIARDDPEHVVDQLSDARRKSLRRLGRGLDELEREVEAFRAAAAEREQQRAAKVRDAARRAGLAVRGRPTTVAWLTEEEDGIARERWAGWTEGLVVDGSFDARRERMERVLRERRADGDGPLVIVRIDVERYAAWCATEGHDAIDRRSRATWVEAERAAGAGLGWPPGRNEPCWCGSGLKYKRCCGALAHSPSSSPAV